MGGTIKKITSKWKTTPTAKSKPVKRSSPSRQPVKKTPMGTGPKERGPPPKPAKRAPPPPAKTAAPKTKKNPMAKSGKKTPPPPAPKTKNNPMAKSERPPPPPKKSASKREEEKQPGVAPTNFGPPPGVAPMNFGSPGVAPQGSASIAPLPSVVPLEDAGARRQRSVSVSDIPLPVNFDGVSHTTDLTDQELKVKMALEEFEMLKKPTTGCKINVPLL